MVSLLLSTMLALNLHYGTERKTRFSRYTGILYGSLFLFSCTTLLETLVNGTPGETARFVMYAACFLDYLLCVVLVLMGSGMLLSRADPEREFIGLRWILHLLAALHLVLLIVSQFNGMFYSLDAGNRYCRGELYPLSLASPALMLLVDIWVLIRHSGGMTRNERNVFWIVLSIPALIVALQSFVQNLVPVGVILSTLVLYFFFAERQIHNSYQQRGENQRLRTEIMLSQIQPHFLYNSLGAIADLCDSDPQKAKQTTLRFSRYFQGVMESLNSRHMVPFARELAQTKLFLELEQVRFEDALRVEYRIGCSDFEMPPMCLQPLVENAVHHGVRRNPDGRGLVVIASAERPDCWEVTVSDDGPGLDQAEPSAGNRAHIGVSNVRERLRLICGGSLELSPGPERGVIAAIRIPKQREEKAC